MPIKPLFTLSQRVSFVFLILVRKWKNKAPLGVKGSQWEYEVGEQLLPRNLDSEGMLESAANVRCHLLNN